MTFTPTPLMGSFVVGLTPFRDERGWFARTFCKEEFSRIGHNKEWLQMNHSMTYREGTIRGMHFQKPPFREIKLVKCIAGAIFDVMVDLREGSPGFLQWFGIELSEQNQQMLYIPEGFAHGFQTLTENCQLIYHHSAMYQPGFEAGIRYNDPAINIEWPLEVTSISDKDAQYSYLEKSFKGI